VAHRTTVAGGQPSPTPTSWRRSLR
jgi:hypothetical protein